MASSDYLKQYQKAFQKTQGYDVNKFATDLEKAYNEKTGYNKDLIEQQNTLQAEAQALPGQLRNEYYQSAIRNPLAQEALISGRQANVRGQLGSVTDLLNARGQQFQDILGKATSAYQTDAQRSQTQAENLWRQYQDQVQQQQFWASRPKSDPGLDPKALKAMQQQQDKQTLLEQIQQIQQARGTQNIESQLPQLHKNLQLWAKSRGIAIDPESLWVAMGNTPKVGYNQNLLSKYFLTK